MLYSIGGRNARTNSVMDLKVYFREFYISDAGYKNQAQTIVRKFIDKYNKSNNVDSFEKNSEYMFLREKISRGYFRETIGLNKYNEKNKLQEMLYVSMLWMFLSFEYDSIYKSLMDFLSGFVALYHGYMKKNFKVFL